MALARIAVGPLAATVRGVIGTLIAGLQSEAQLRARIAADTTAMLRA